MSLTHGAIRPALVLLVAMAAIVTPLGAGSRARAAAPQFGTVTGTWHIVLNIQGYPMASGEFRLIQHGSRVTGTWTNGPRHIRIHGAINKKGAMTLHVKFHVKYITKPSYETLTMTTGLNSSYTSFSGQVTGILILGKLARRLTGAITGARTHCLAQCAP